MTAHSHTRRVVDRALAKRRAGEEATSLLRPFGLALHVALGRVALLALFLVVPVLNPAIFTAGEERLYVGTVVALAAVALMLPSVFAPRFRWILVGLFLATLWVLETGLLRGDLALGIVGNAYRPLHAVLVFCACAVLLTGADRYLWTRIFLVGGLVGCALAVVHAFVPAFDPFALSRPDDLPIESRFITSRREEGAFVYPGNFGPYAAYVAIVALVTLEQRRIRLASLNLYTAAFAVGALGIAVSGSRAAALGLLAAGLVVVWRSRPLRLPLAVASVAGAVALAVVAAATGRLGELAESRVFTADFSLELRLGSWEASLEAFRLSPLYGSGVVPNTIDSTFFYLLHVGGIVGLLIVAAMYWTTLLRPLRRRDWGPLPLVVAVGAAGIFQDSLATPLTTWAIGAGVFLLAREASVLGPPPPADAAADDTRAGPLERLRRYAARPGPVRTPLLVAAAGAVAALLVLAWPDRDLRNELRNPRNSELAPLIALADSHEVRGLPPAAAVRLATNGDLPAAPGEVWVGPRDAGTAGAIFRVAGGEATRLGRLPATNERAAGAAADAVFDVTEWGRLGAPSVVTGLARRDGVSIRIAPVVRTAAASVQARVPLRAPTGHPRHVALATWSGRLPDLFVVDRASPTGGVRVTAFSGESGFRERLFSVERPLDWRLSENSSFHVAHTSGRRPDLVEIRRDSPSGAVEIHVLSGDSLFHEGILHQATDIRASEAAAHELALGRTEDGDVALHALRREDGRWIHEVRPVPLLGGDG